MFSNRSLKAVCQQIFTKCTRLSPFHRRQKDRGIPTKLIDMVDITTLDHVVDMVLLKVKTRPNRKSRTCLMISDAQITLTKKNMTLFSIGLNQMITCFTLPFEPRAIALVFKKESDDGYCCVCLMLQKALTSLSGHHIWDLLCYKQTFSTIHNMNRKFTEETDHINLTNDDPLPSPIASHSLTNVSSGLSFSSITTVTSTPFTSSITGLSSFMADSASSLSGLATPPTQSPQIQQSTISMSLSFTSDADHVSGADSCSMDESISETSIVLRSVFKDVGDSGDSQSDSGTEDSLSNIQISISGIDHASLITDTSCTKSVDTGISTDYDIQHRSTAGMTVFVDDCNSEKIDTDVSVTELEQFATSSLGDDNSRSSVNQTLITDTWIHNINEREDGDVSMETNGRDNSFESADRQSNILISKSESNLSFSDTDLTSCFNTGRAKPIHGNCMHSDDSKTCSWDSSSYFQFDETNLDNDNSRSDIGESCHTSTAGGVSDAISNKSHSHSNTFTGSSISLSSSKRSPCTANVWISEGDSNHDQDSPTSRTDDSTNSISPSDTPEADCDQSHLNGSMDTIPNSNSDLSLCSCKHCRLCYSESESCSGCSDCSCTDSCSCCDSDTSEDVFSLHYDGDIEDI